MGHTISFIETLMFPDEVERDCEIDATCYKGCRPTFYDPGEPDYAEINSVTCDGQDVELTDTQREILELRAMDEANERYIAGREAYYDAKMDDARMEGRLP